MARDDKGKIEVMVKLLDEVSPTLEKIKRNLKEFGDEVPQPNTSGIDSLKSSFFNLQNAMKGFLALKVVGVIKDLANESLKAASDMTELENVTQQVFGNSMKEIEEFSRSTGEMVGRSTYQMQKYVSQMGAVLKGLGGFDDSAIKKMSERLSMLAVDMGSFMNRSDEDAFAALRGGILGETEQLKTFGVVLSDTVMQQYALQQGYRQAWATMDQATKVQLRFNKLLESTSFMQGDAARTINSYANQIKVAKANISNLAVTIGQRLIPTANSVLGVVGRMAKALNDWLNKKDLEDYTLEFVKQKNELASLKEKYIDLSKQKLETGISNDKEKERLELYNQMISKYPQLKEVISSEAREWGKVEESINGVIQSLKNKVIAEFNQDFLNKMVAQANKFNKFIQEQGEKVQEQIAELENETKNGEFAGNLLTSKEIVDKIGQLIDQKASSGDQKYYDEKILDELKKVKGFNNEISKNLDDVESAVYQTYEANSKISESMKNQENAMNKSFAEHEKEQRSLQTTLDQFSSSSNGMIKFTSWVGNVIDGNNKHLQKLTDNLKGIKSSVDSSVTASEKTYDETVSNSSLIVTTGGKVTKDNKVISSKLNAPLLAIESKNASKLDILLGNEKGEFVDNTHGIYTYKYIENGVAKAFSGSLDKVVVFMQNRLSNLSGATSDYKPKATPKHHSKGSTSSKTELSTELDSFYDTLSKSIESLTIEVNKKDKHSLEQVKNLMDKLEKNKMESIKELENINAISSVEANNQRIQVLKEKMASQQKIGDIEGMKKTQQEIVNYLVENIKNNAIKAINEKDLSRNLNNLLDLSDSLNTEADKLKEVKEKLAISLDSFEKELLLLPKEAQEKIKHADSLSEIGGILKELQEKAQGKEKNVYSNILETLDQLEKFSAKSKDKLKQSVNYEQIWNGIKKNLQTLSEILDENGKKQIKEITDSVDEAFAIGKEVMQAVAAAASKNIPGAVMHGLTVATMVFSDIFAMINGVKDKGIKKANEQLSKDRVTFNKELLSSQKSLIESIQALSTDVRNFNNTLVKQYSNNISSKNLDEVSNNAKEIALLYANSFNATIKTTVQRTKESFRWFGLVKDTEVIGTESKEEELRKILGIPKFKNAKDIMKWYDQIKNTSYVASFTKPKDDDGVMYGHYFKDRLVGTNYNDVLNQIPRFAENVKKAFEQADKIKTQTVYESLEGISTTDIDEKKEQYRNILKKLMENTGEDYSKISDMVEKKLDELVKGQDKVVTAFDGTRHVIIDNMSKGFGSLDSVATGLQNYFNMIRSNISKIQYDLSFRGRGNFEENFINKFKEISDKLVKIRLDGNKTIKDLTDKDLDFKPVFAQLKELANVSNDVNTVVEKLREQAKQQGLNDDIIDKMLPVTKAVEKAREFANAIKDGLRAALNTDTFSQFTMSFGKAIYDATTNKLIQAFIDSKLGQQLIEKTMNINGFSAELSNITNIHQGFDLLQKWKRKTEDTLRAEGYDFRATNGYTGEYLGGSLMNNNASPVQNASVLAQKSYGVELTVNVENHGFISTEDLTNDLLNKFRNLMYKQEKKEV